MSRLLHESQAMKVHQVNAANVHKLPFGGTDRIVVLAEGTVMTSGWSNGRLSPFFYSAPPANGIWEFDFLADPPSGMTLALPMPIVAEGVFNSPDWMTGVVVYGDGNSAATAIHHAATPTNTVSPQFSVSPQAVIYRRDLTSYDDSWGQIGFCGGFHIKMHKLVHVLTLVIEGPDMNTIQNCVAQSVGVGLLAALIAVYATGGAALQAAIAAFVANLEQCLTNAYAVSIQDTSHWEEWCS